MCVPWPVFPTETKKAYHVNLFWGNFFVYHPYDKFSLFSLLFEITDMSEI